MFPDWLVNRILLRIAISVLHLLGPFALLWTILAVLLQAPPPLVVLSLLPREDVVDKLYEYERSMSYLSAYMAIEALWLFLHGIGRYLVAHGWWDLATPKEKINAEERWRLWVAMLEASEGSDPWTWLQGMFLVPGRKFAPCGMEDPAIINVRLQDVGRTNVEQFIAHFMFGLKLRDVKPGSLEKAEIHSMVLLLEAALRQTRPDFTFLRGRTGHRTFLVNDEPIRARHHPLIFYASVWFISELGNAALWLAGFRFYGPKRSWPFPLFLMRGSRTAVENAQDPEEAQKMGDPTLAHKVGYWYHPGSTQAQEAALTPIIAFHGISGTYGPSPFLIYLQKKTGRAMVLPELPYVGMRLSPPSAIRTRVEMVAAMRRAIWRHGHGATWEDDDDDDENERWRRGRAVLVGHSLGAAPVGWMLRSAPDVVAGTILIDPMSILLFSADSARNFFRTRTSTAGEIFFKYFASERAIHHFLARHLSWSDSVIFGPQPVSPLADPIKRAIVPRMALEPLDPPFDRPNYAQYVSPLPQGPFPTVVFLSENDCILPANKMASYLRKTGFVDDDNLFVMPKLEHAAILVRPHWADKVALAIDQVAKASDKWWNEPDQIEATASGIQMKQLENGQDLHKRRNGGLEAELELDQAQ